MHSIFDINWIQLRKHYAIITFRFILLFIRFIYWILNHAIKPGTQEIFSSLFLYTCLRKAIQTLFFSTSKPITWCALTEQQVKLSTSVNKVIKKYLAFCSSSSSRPFIWSFQVIVALYPMHNYFPISSMLYLCWGYSNENCVLVLIHMDHLLEIRIDTIGYFPLNS